jgi:hypothetical protein
MQWIKTSASQFLFFMKQRLRAILPPEKQNPRRGGKF